MLIWRAGTTPILEKIAPRMEAQMKIFHVGSHQFPESLQELLWEFWFSHCSTRETPFWEWYFSFRQIFFQLRELLREYPETLPELREWPFRSKSIFPEIGVVPRLICWPMLQVLLQQEQCDHEMEAEIAWRALCKLVGSSRTVQSVGLYAAGCHPPSCLLYYTLARKDYIHNFLFSELISRKFTLQLQEIFFGINFLKLDITFSFVIQRITWKILFGNYFLEKSHFSYMK